MKRKYKIIGTVLTGFLLFAIAGTDSVIHVKAVDQTDVQDAQNNADATAQKIEELKSQLTEISANISDVQGYITELDTMMADYTSQIVDYQAQIDAKTVEINNKQAEIDDKQKNIDAMQEELDATKTKEAEQYDAMKKRIQYMYECGEETFLDMIFGSEDLSELLGTAEYVSSITSYDRQQMEALAGTKDKIQTLLASLESEKVTLENEQASLKTEKNNLISLQAEVESRQTYANMVLEEKEKKLTELEQEQSTAEELKAMAEKDLAEQQRIAAQIKAQWEEEQRQAAQTGGNADGDTQKTLEAIGLAGGFTWPIPGYNYITSEWGNRLHPILGYYTLHDGMDISGAGIYGKPIVAAYDGVVSIADSTSSTGYGYYVKIDHGTGVSTLYAHCSSLAVSVGQPVSAGQVIGYIGSTGNSTGAHLHFSIFIKGESVNPRDYITIP